ncbi:MAG: hypothetical protein ACI9N1_002685 [Flavobacteriales bacterium]|jgi:hypothetical protein
MKSFLLRILVSPVFSIRSRSSSDWNLLDFIIKFEPWTIFETQSQNSSDYVEVKLKTSTYKL